MDAITVNNNPVTIKTLEIGGKKLTKQLLQQIELEQFKFKKNNDSFKKKTYSLGYLDELYENTSDYKLDGQLIGYFNLTFNENISDYMPFNKKILVKELYIILFINSYGVLKREYIKKTTFQKVFGMHSIQLFI